MALTTTLQPQIEAAAPAATSGLGLGALAFGLFSMMDALVKWLAPILAFTAEETWLSRHPDAVSVHLELFPELPDSWLDPALEARWDKLIDEAGNATDPAKQNDLLRQANNLLQEEAPVWFFNYNKAVMAYQPWVHGLKPNGAEMAIQDYEDIWIDDSAPASRK